MERRIDKCQKAAKGGDKRFLREAEVFTELLAHLNEGKLARTFDPYVKKKSPWPAVIFIFLLVLIAVGLVLYFTGNLGWLGITK